MIIVMKRGASEAVIDTVVAKLESIGSERHVSHGQVRPVIGALPVSGVAAAVGRST